MIYIWDSFLIDEGLFLWKYNSDLSADICLIFFPHNENKKYVFVIVGAWNFFQVQSLCLIQLISNYLFFIFTLRQTIQKTTPTQFFNCLLQFFISVLKFRNLIRFHFILSYSSESEKNFNKFDIFLRKLWSKGEILLLKISPGDNQKYTFSFYRSLCLQE